MKRRILALLCCVIILLCACGTQKTQNMEGANRDKMKKVFENTTKSNKVHEAILYVENTDGTLSESFSYNGRELDTPMLCASVTKLFTTTCILQLCEEEKISLEDKISEYFDKETLSGLHVYKGKEYSYDLTIYHLLSQTSGLPDSLEDGDNSYINDMGDVYSPFEDNLARAKTETPHFAPGTGNKARYANINFDLLGEIIEKVTGKSLKDVYDEMIFKPMKMEHTYLAISENDFIPYSYYKEQKIYRPLIVSSSGAAGGCVSTPRDLMTFSKAFWGGKLFDKSVFEKLDTYKSLQINKGPINYGGGYMEIPLGGLNTMFMCKGSLIGHCGSTGSFVFYYPEKDLHIVGDLAEITDPALPIRLVMQIASVKIKNN